MLTRRVPGWSRWLGAMLSVALAISGTFLARPLIQPSVSLLFFPAVVIPSMFLGYGPALLATVLSTSALAYFFIPPHYSFNTGIDDLIRLIVFAVIALATASVSSARKRAEDARRRSMDDLREANAVLRKLTEWPPLVGADTAAVTRRMLCHAAGIVGAVEVLVIWEAEGEPWMYVAVSSRGGAITKHRTAEQSALLWEHLSGPPQAVDSGKVPDERSNPALRLELAVKHVRSVPFKTEHLAGRVFFTGMTDFGEKAVPAVELVAREVGSSLDQLYLTDQMRGVAAHEERIRLARDLHDGVLQALTGIRLQLESMAIDGLDPLETKDSLLAIERAIAIQQRELRLFVDDARPEKRARNSAGDLVQGLEDMRRRLGLEWKTPISIQVPPSLVSLPQETYRTLSLMIHEAVINALKHGHPSRVSVDIFTDAAAQLRIVVNNDGRGFPFTGRLEHDALLEANAGPASLRDRVAALGGRMAVESGPGGTSVEILLPIEV